MATLDELIAQQKKKLGVQVPEETPVEIEPVPQSTYEPSPLDNLIAKKKLADSIPTINIVKGEITPSDQGDLSSWFDQAINKQVMDSMAEAESQTVQQPQKSGSIEDLFSAISKTYQKPFSENIKEAALQSTPLTMLFSDTFQKASSIPTSLWEETAKYEANLFNEGILGKSPELEPDAVKSLTDLYSGAKQPSAARAYDYLAGKSESEANQDQPIVKEIAASIFNPYELAFGGAISKAVDKIAGIASKSPQIAEAVMKEIDNIVASIGDDTASTWSKQIRKGVYELVPQQQKFYSEATEEPFKVLARPQVQPNVYVPEAPPQAYTSPLDPFRQELLKNERTVFPGATPSMPQSKSLWFDPVSEGLQRGTTPNSIGQFSAQAGDISGMIPQVMKAKETIPSNLIEQLSQLPKSAAYTQIDSMQLDDMSKELLKQLYYDGRKVGGAATPLKTALQETTPRPVLSTLEEVPYPQKYSVTSDPYYGMSLEQAEYYKKIAPQLKKGGRPTGIPTDAEVAASIKGTTPTFLESTPSINPQDPPKIGNFLQSFRTRINKLGDIGKSMANKIDAMFKYKMMQTGHSMKNVKIALSDLTDSELSNLVEVLDDGAFPMNEKVHASSVLIRKEFDRVRQAAENSLLKFKGLENYFPHMFEDDVIKQFRANDNFLKEQAAKIFKDGKFGSIEEAENYLKEYFRSNHASRKFGSLDFHRLQGIDGWIRDPKKVLPKYFEDAWERLAEVKYWGLEDGTTKTPEVWNMLVAKMKTQYGIDDSHEISKFLEVARRQVFQDYNISTTADQAFRNIASWEVLSKMGLAQVTNLGQSVNTAARTSFLDTVQGIYKTLKNPKEVSELTDDAGHFINSFAEDLANSVYGESLSQKLASKFLKATGFEKFERFNRMVAAHATKTFMNRQFGKLLNNPANKYARNELVKLGVDVDKALKRGFLVEDEILDGAYQVINDTQFSNNPLDLPVDYQTPFWKLVFQFKSFAYKQTGFLKKHVYDEAKKFASTGGKQGSLLPLANLGLATATIGEITSDAKAVLKDTVSAATGDFSFEKTNERLNAGLLERQIDNFLGVGGLGLAYDMFNSAQYGELAYGNFLAGPGLSDVGQIGYDLAKTSIDLASGGDTGKSLQKLFRDVASKTPVVGQSLKKMMKPAKSNSRASLRGKKIR